MNETLINLDSHDLRTPIYRVFDIQRLLESCALKKNVLARPELWDDPFENFIIKVAVTGHGYYGSTVVNGFYGQCWSMLEESDAMWRIYSPNKNGVKVKTTMGKLIKSLSTSRENKMAQGECFIGKVSYMEDELLRKKLQDRAWLDDEIADTKSQATSLLFKRFEFEHEAEIRLLCLPLAFPRGQKIFSYTIDPLKLFDEIQFDPRISKEMFEVYKHYLETVIGFTNPIKKSKLYEVPNIL